MNRRIKSVSLINSESIMLDISKTSSLSYVSSEKTKSDLSTSQKISQAKSNSSNLNKNINKTISTTSTGWREWNHLKASLGNEFKKIKEEQQREVEEFKTDNESIQSEEEKLSFHEWLDKKRKQNETKKKPREKLFVHNSVLNICTQVKDCESLERVRTWSRQQEEQNNKRDDKKEVERRRSELEARKKAPGWCEWAKRARMRALADKTTPKPFKINHKEFEKKLRKFWLNPRPLYTTISENEDSNETETSDIECTQSQKTSSKNVFDRVAT